MVREERWWIVIMTWFDLISGNIKVKYYYSSLSSWAKFCRKKITSKIFAKLKFSDDYVEKSILQVLVKVMVPPSSSSLFYFLTLSQKIKKHTLSLFLCTFSHTPFSPIPSLFSSIFLLNQLLFSLLFLSPTSLFLLLLLFSFTFFWKFKESRLFNFPYHYPSHMLIHPHFPLLPPEKWPYYHTYYLPSFNYFSFLFQTSFPWEKEMLMIWMIPATNPKKKTAALV